MRSAATTALAGNHDSVGFPVAIGQVWGTLSDYGSLDQGYEFLPRQTESAGRSLRGFQAGSSKSMSFAQPFDAEKVVACIVHRMSDDPVRINVCAIQNHGRRPGAGRLPSTEARSA